MKNGSAAIWTVVGFPCLVQGFHTLHIAAAMNSTSIAGWFLWITGVACFGAAAWFGRNQRLVRVVVAILLGLVGLYCACLAAGVSAHVGDELARQNAIIADALAALTLWAFAFVVFNLHLFAPPEQEQPVLPT